MKIAFAAIIKGADEEAEQLENLLDSVSPYVDGLYITITQENEKVKTVAEKYGAVVSYFEWVGDFSAARNYNFAQVPKEYDFIMWGDADDTFIGLDTLMDSIQDVTADAYLMWYLYDFDKYGAPNVVHAKTMLVKNDKSFIWKGRIHEDIDANREIEVFMLQDVKRIHHPTEERIQESSERNLGIALTEDEEDPRTWWNRANAFLSLAENDKAANALQRFLEVSNSDSEKYLALLRMSGILKEAGDLKRAIAYCKKAIGLNYDWPDAYFALGECQMEKNEYYDAEKTILDGLKKKAPKYSMVVWNPRDYDYNPLMLLAKCYWEMGRPKEALVCFNSCKEIQPLNEALTKMIDIAHEEADLYEVVHKAVKKLHSYKTLKSAKKLLDSLPTKVREHPVISHWANQKFIKKESSGKDIVYYCGMSHEEWNPDSIKDGIGGSEEAVILLTQEWAKNGYNVTVYTNCGPEKTYNGVHWKPWYLYNPKDKQDITILWRSFKALDYKINSDKIYVDLHDTVKAGEMTEKRLELIDKIFVKSKAHRKLYPKVHSNKFAIITNPLDNKLFSGQVERDPFLIINTSSPERSLEAVCRIFKKINEKEPRAKMKWAYGWQGFETMRMEDDKSTQWMNAIKEYMEVLGIEDLGRISHEEVAKLYKEATVFLYPTKFYEIDCISARKAQIAGCAVVSSNFAALDETIVLGTKVQVETDIEKWSKGFEVEFGDLEENDEKYVQAVLHGFEHGGEKLDASRYEPKHIARKWSDVWES